MISCYGKPQRRLVANESFELALAYLTLSLKLVLAYLTLSLKLALAYLTLSLKLTLAYLTLSLKLALAYENTASSKHTQHGQSLDANIMICGFL